MDKIKFEVMNKIAKTNFKTVDIKKLSKVDTISPPSVFVGSKLRYPNVNVGILSPLEKEENAWMFDAPKYWAEKDFQVGEVVKLRDNLLNSRFRSNVHSVRSRMENKFVNIVKEIAIASKPVDVEIELKKKMYFARKKDRVLLHQGLKAPLKKAKITSNVKVERAVDKVINDEIKSTEGLAMLYQKGFAENVLSKILSVGVMGLKKNKRMVPTRWSITATDDTISKEHLKRIRDYNWIEDHELFFGEFMGNQYLILMFPGVWSYELFELYYPGSSWNPGTELKASTDDEGFHGRKKYASNTVGGYYAARLPITKYLDSIKRQASVLVIRLETPSYWAALGVWVVRESVKKALQKRMKFDSREELLDGMKKIAKIKYDFDPDYILSQSKLLKRIKTEKNFFHSFKKSFSIVNFIPFFL
jgi:hypothetical protein